MRLIDADALSEWLKDYGQKVIKGERKISLMYVWKHIQDMQTNEERKTGKWINMIEKGMCYCNQCGFTQETERAYASLFCAKCGAQMNGGDANV